MGLAMFSFSLTDPKFAFPLSKRFAESRTMRFLPLSALCALSIFALFELAEGKKPHLKHHHHSHGHKHSHHGQHKHHHSGHHKPHHGHHHRHRGPKLSQLSNALLHQQQQQQEPLQPMLPILQSMANGTMNGMELTVSISSC